MKIENTLSDTAYLTAGFRALDVKMSRDRFAHLWLSGRTRAIAADFRKALREYEGAELALRHRFFLSALKQFRRREHSAKFINLGAGFTSYPHLVAPIDSLEVDLPGVIRLKASRIAAWEISGILPRRLVKRSAIDITSRAGFQQLHAILQSFIGAARSFVLLEGVSYYLSREEFSRLLACIRAVQRPGSILAFDFWSGKVSRSRLFSRLQVFFSEHFNCGPADYTFYRLSDIRSLRGYRLQICTDARMLHQQYAQQSSKEVDLSKTLQEEYILMRRVGEERK